MVQTTKRKRQTQPSTQGTETVPGPGVWSAAGIYFALAIVYFLPAFLPDRHIYGSDYLAGAFFAHEFISERLAGGALPKWVPYLYGGLPMFANPGSAFYPFRFLADLIFPVERIFPALYVLQCTLGGIGMYLLTRELDARRWIALLAGLAFEFTGLTMSFVLAGHDGRMIVATFAPLFLFFLHRGVRTGGLPWFAGAAATLGFSLLSFQIQSNYYLLLAGAAWGVFALVQVRNTVPRRALAVRAALGLAAVAIAFAMAGINFLPFLDYVDASPRGGPGRGYEYATSWSMPPAEVTGLALPEHAGLLQLYQGVNPFKLHTEYVGGVVVLLTLLGAWTSRRDRYWWFFAVLALFALSISLGGHTPLYRLYYELLPGTDKFRAPSIAFFLVSLSLVVMAARTLEGLAVVREDRPSSLRGIQEAPLRPAFWILAGASAFTLVVLLGAAGGASESAYGEALAEGALRWALVTWLTAAMLWSWLRRSAPSSVAAAVLAVLVLADLWIVDRAFFETVEPSEFMFAADGVVRALEAQPDPFRVWVLPVAAPGAQPYRGHTNYLMHFDIEQAGGEHGNHLQRWGEFVGAGEVTYVDWHNFLADLQRLVEAPPGESMRANFLAAANVRYIVSTLALPGLPQLYAGPEAIVYEVPNALPRAWLVRDVIVVDEPDGALRMFAQADFDPGTTAILHEPLPTPLPGGTLEGGVEVVEQAPDRVRIRATASRRALLVLADNHYQGWEATIDGVETPVLRVNHTFRGVVVPEGRHEIIFSFRPPALYAGLGISVAAAAALLVITLVATVRHHRAESG